MIPRSVKAPDDPDPVPQAAQGGRDRRRGERRRPSSSSTRSPRRTSRSRSPTASTATSPRMPRSGAYIALIDGERLEQARQAGPRGARHRLPHAAVGAGGFAPHLRPRRCSALTGEVDGYIYLGQQTPAFYAKQVVASVVKYGMSLLPPFFGGLMAYDARGQHRLRLPGAPGRPVLPQVARRAALLQALRREHLPQRPVQCRRGSRRPADPRGRRRARRSATPRRCSAPTRTYFVLNGTSTSNKVVTNAVLRRGDLVLFDRNNHKSLHQGALVQAGAIPIFLPTARNAFGMIGAVDWDAWDEEYLREQIRAQPARHGQAAAQGASARSASPASSSRPTTARSTTCARCWRRSATCATTCCGTRPGSATTPSIRCSTTTARCAWRT